MRQSDALRIVNKARRMFPELDFTNITLHDADKYQYRFPVESAGICNGMGDIHVAIPRSADKQNSGNAFIYAAFFNTLVHEAIHRYVLHRHGIEHHGHGAKFQNACLKFGLDPIKETSHDDTVKYRKYPTDRKTYKKYRDYDGHVQFHYDEPEEGIDEHEECYNNNCPTYGMMTDAVRGMRMCKAPYDSKMAKYFRANHVENIIKAFVRDGEPIGDQLKPYDRSDFKRAKKLLKESHKTAVKYYQEEIDTKPKEYGLDGELIPEEYMVQWWGEQIVKLKKEYKQMKKILKELL